MKTTLSICLLLLCVGCMPEGLADPEVAADYIENVRDTLEVATVQAAIVMESNGDDPNDLLTAATDVSDALTLFAAELRVGDVPVDMDDVLANLSAAVKILSVVNTASTPVNPYAIPIGAVLATIGGVAAIWSRKRRKPAA